MSDRKRIVFWSGGYDSTLLVLREVLEAKKNGNEVFTWSLVWDHLAENKLASEKLCRKMFIDFVKSAHNVDIVNSVIDLKHEPNPGGNGLMQASLFIPLCTYLAPDNSTVVFGFHKKDDYWQVFSGLENACKIISQVMNKDVELEYPLRGDKKWEIIRDVRNAGIERFCWTCETPRGVMCECGECEPCINKKVAEHELSLRNAKYADKKDSFDKVVDEIGEIKNSVKESTKLEMLKPVKEIDDEVSADQIERDERAEELEERDEVIDCPLLPDQVCSLPICEPENCPEKKFNKSH
jgi:7-cyano-7-deazaguanine synthase in queuosine biosynthesis